VDEAQIEQHYERVLARCRASSVPAYMLQQSVDYRNGLWKAYRSVLDSVPLPVAGLRVVDFGCKYGHLLPLLYGLGCAQAIGIDAEEEYVRWGHEVLSAVLPGARVVKCEIGYIPLQPESVDLVIMNEVISHVNPGYLDTVWTESARILRPGGRLFISDGNNRASPEVRRALVELYDKWENGPEGVQTDRDTVRRPFRERRAQIVRERYPDMPEAEVQQLARDTSGLFGDFFLHTIDQYVRTGEFVRRPYRRGACPVNPGAAGVVMERAFDPLHLCATLAEYGFSAQQTGDSPSPAPRQFLRTRLRNLVHRVPPPEAPVPPGFTVLATKAG
jgi:SAM-dependent methyltransferase